MPASHSHSTNGAVVGEHRRLPRGPHREDSWGPKMVLGSRGTAGTPSSPPIWLSTAPASSARLPTCTGSVPSPCQCTSTCPEGVTLAFSQPSYTRPFLLSSNKSLVHAAPQAPGVNSQAPACLAQLQAVPLQRCSLLQSWLSPPAAPTSHPPGGCSELC